jgi:molecular chaperone HtpG
MQKGSIRVQTENIFPIIKKFLYSEHDIFIRELVSNAVDASQKLKTLSSIGEMKGEIGDLRIDITIDQENKTLTIADRGVGMSAEEVDKYLNQVAFSGAEEFLEKYKGQNEANIIGHFGLGFYSSFMVSSKVEVISKSFREEGFRGKVFFGRFFFLLFRPIGFGIRYFGRLIPTKTLSLHDCASKVNRSTIRTLTLHRTIP